MGHTEGKGPALSDGRYLQVFSGLSGLILCSLLFTLALEEHGAQRWQCEVKRVWAAVEGDGRCLNAAQIAMAAAAILLGIAIQDLSPVAPAGNAHTVVEAWNWSEVADHEQDVLYRTAFANETEDVAL